VGSSGANSTLIGSADEGTIGLTPLLRLCRKRGVAAVILRFAQDRCHDLIFDSLCESKIRWRQ